MADVRAAATGVPRAMAVTDLRSDLWSLGMVAWHALFGNIIHITYIKENFIER